MTKKPLIDITELPMPFSGPQSADEAALALGIDKDLAALKARYKLVAAAMDWSKSARHTHHYIGVLADEVDRLRKLLPHQPPKDWL